MTDFVTSNGPFHIFKGDCDKRKKLISDLVDCILAHVSVTFSLCLVTADYDSVNEYYPLREVYGPPYAFAGQIIIEKTREWLRKKRAPSTIEYFFEWGDQHQGELDTRSRRTGTSLNFRTKEEMAQFQPGDLVAWKYRQAATDASVGTRTSDIAMLDSALRSLDSLRSLYGFNGVFNIDSMIEACEKSGVTKRQ